MRHTDHLRRVALLEPRGYVDMVGAVMTEPVNPGSHAGLLFMHNEGFNTLSGHGVINAATIASARGVELQLAGRRLRAPQAYGADLRNATVFAAGQVDPSPCATGTAAVMDALVAMGLLPEGQKFVHGSLEAIVPEIEGSAWITGEHTFEVDDADPLGAGFRLG